MSMDKQSSTENENKPDATGTLPREVWRDDKDPVARTAKAYERAIRSINKAQVPPPWYERVGAYIAGGLVGAIPGAVIYAFTRNKTATQEVITHTAMTAGVVVGVDIADSLMEMPHMNKQSQETADFLEDARQQVKTSYAQSIAEQKEAASQTIQRG